MSYLDLLCLKNMNPTILCTLTAQHTPSLHAKKLHNLHREFQNTIMLMGCSQSHLIQTMSHIRKTQIPEQKIHYL
jgi:hypothetical protein